MDTESSVSSVRFFVFYYLALVIDHLPEKVVHTFYLSQKTLNKNTNCLIVMCIVYTDTQP